MQISSLIFLMIFFSFILLFVTIYFRYLALIKNHYKRLDFLLELDIKSNDNIINALIMIAKTKNINYPQEKKEEIMDNNRYRILTDI